MKADYEPWWQFEGWESFIEWEQEFTTEQALEEAVVKSLADFRVKYEYERQKEARYFAFWSEEECEYCEACDDEAQVYHGLIVVKPSIISN